MLTPGTVLQNRYRIDSLLGQGGMGAVYKAWHLYLNVPVAVKEMVPQPGIDPQMLAGLRQQFYQEAQVLARLNHPNLVRVIDYFEEGGNAYLVMDFAEGQSLADLIAQQGPLPEAQVLEWANQLLDALDYCHRQGVVHRDIKPGNIIIRSDGRPVLVDFGLVKLWDPRDPSTRTAIRGMGTPEYAPPEQYGVWGHTDPRSDLYSLGATLYHALTGQAPLTATKRTAYPGQFLTPRSLNALVSPRTEAVILKAMELSVGNRFANAAAMRAALKGRAVRGWVWAAVGLGVITGLMCIAGLIGWGLWQHRTQQKMAAALQATATAQVQATAIPKVQVTATAQVQATATPKAQVTATAQVQATATPKAQVTATAQVQATATQAGVPSLALTGTPVPQPAAPLFPASANRFVQLVRWGIITGILLVLALGIPRILRKMGRHAVTKIVGMLVLAAAAIYLLLLRASPSLQEIWKAISLTRPSPAPPPLSTPTVVPLNEIRVGIEVEVITTGSRLNIREWPGVNATVIAQADPGTHLKVMDGPRQADGYTWWQVRLPDGTIGWAAGKWLRPVR